MSALAATTKTSKTRRLRELIASGGFLYMPSAATPLEGRLAEAAGTPLVYTGRYVSGASRVITEPLHTMRTVREFAAAGVAGIHIEDQLYPKRAHYHGYQVHATPTPDFVAKIKYCGRWAIAAASTRRSCLASRCIS